MSFEFGAWQAAEANYNDAVRSLNRANANIDKANEIIREKNARIAELEDQLAISKANIAGRLAQYEAFAAQHSQSPLLADSGARFADGDVKTRIRLIFEAAFDVAAKKLGIANPAARRAN